MRVLKSGAFLPVLIAAMIPFLVITVIVVATAVQLVAWQPSVLWERSLGSGGVTVIASDSSGVYARGSGFGGSSGGPFLDKYDPGGGVVWNRTMSETGDFEISAGLDGVYLSGENATSGILLKYDLAGNRLWERDFPVNYVNDISASPQGAYLTEGGLVREYDSAGNIVWTSKLSNDTVVSSRVYASVAGVFITYAGINQTNNLGPFLVKYSLSGSEIWTHPVAVGGGISGDTTGIYLAGSSLYKYDFNGNQEWMTQINSLDGSPISGSWVSVDSSGIYVSAISWRYNSYLFRYDFGGRQVWSVRLPASFESKSYRVSSSFGTVYVGGSLSDGRDMVERLSVDASLVFFGLDSPWSFMILGSLISASAISIISFRRLRRNRLRPHPARPTQLSPK